MIGEVEKMLAELQRRLPEPWRDGGTELQPEMFVSYERRFDGDRWEVEWTPCDQRRNCLRTGPKLADVLRGVLEYDDAGRKPLPDDSKRGSE